jgi:hypothetical protein
VRFGWAADRLAGGLDGKPPGCPARRQVRRRADAWVEKLAASQPDIPARELAGNLADRAADNQVAESPVERVADNPVERAAGMSSGGVAGTPPELVAPAEGVADSPPAAAGKPQAVRTRLPAADRIGGATVAGRRSRGGRKMQWHCPPTFGAPCAS